MSEWSGVERIVQKRLTLIPLAIIYNLNAHTRTRRMNGLFICFGIVCVRHRPVYLFVDLYILCVCVCFLLFTYKHQQWHGTLIRKVHFRNSLKRDLGILIR